MIRSETQMNLELPQDFQQYQHKQRWLCTAFHWHHIAQHPAPDADDLSGRNLLVFTRAYLRHLLHTEGVQMFTSDIEHHRCILDAVRATEAIYSAMASLRADKASPESQETIQRAIEALRDFLTQGIHELDATISAIQAQHPGLSGYFSNERRMYAEWRRGEGVLAGTDWWSFDDKEAA
jgi:hypothetical protein